MDIDLSVHLPLYRAKSHPIIQCISNVYTNKIYKQEKQKFKKEGEKEVKNFAGPNPLV